MRIIFLSILFKLFSFGLMAQAGNANQPLIDAVAQFNSGNDPKTLVATFEKLVPTTSVSNAWIPSYYLALLNASLSIKNKNLADPYADKAIYWANLSIAASPNDENYCALSMAKISKMAVNPFLRWVTYEKSIYAALKVAKNANPLNPRIYILEGSLTLNLPSLFGGGCDKAKPMLTKARELLDKQNPQILLPTWGKQRLEEFKQGCSF
jgi:hypothetical protein